MNETILTDFRPSVHGFPFTNRWRDTVWGVVPSRGRCGGMVFAALDHFHAGVPLPAHGGAEERPAHDSKVAQYVWRRQLASVFVSLARNPLRFVVDTVSPSQGRHGIVARTRDEIEPLLERLRAGNPVPLGLIATTELRRIGRNHQVLAWGADVSELLVTIRIYDPNYPLRDDVILEIPRYGDGFVVERSGERRKAWRGLFVERYAPVERPAEEMETDPRGVRRTGGLAAFGAVLIVVFGVLRLARRKRRS